MKKILMVTAAFAGMMMTGQAEAQFSALKATAESTAGAVADVAAPGDISQESIVQSYIAANALVDDSNESLLEAFGEKEKAAKYRETADGFHAGSTEGDKGAMKDRAVHSQETSEFIAALIEEGAVVSADGREKYVEGLALAVQSVMATKGMAGDARAFATSAQADIKSASMMQKAKVMKKMAAGMFVAKQLPGFTSRLTENLGALMAYAKSADIPTPDDATAAMASL